MIEAEGIAPAAISREAKIDAAEFCEWLGGGKKPAEFMTKLAEFAADRATVRQILCSVGNDLRAIAASKMLDNIAHLAAAMAGCNDEAERDDLLGHMSLFLLDLKSIIALMGREQTIRSALLPGDKLMIMKSGGKATAGRAAE
ncbi:MAG TPA: hypothetical protein VKS22_12165 [Candidatus Binataceae bacterium]|nr:hypothetical protein [Candidatus Binataceae bacterium]